ncbi:aminoacyl-tRNA hydrolase [candidate division KSB1 bacterium]|nr:aminoacyl-tRNA hydrolase [candidate division KSB1 bacterium]
MVKLVAFLGNPGIKYAKTRHNIAWLLTEEGGYIDSLSWQKKFNGYYAVNDYNGEKVYFLKPSTYMNRSGSSIQALASFYKITQEEILVVHDEIEIDFGVISFKRNGGLAGHNGLRSTAESLGTRDFLRFRLGISRPDHPDISSYVLNKFTPEENEQLPRFLQKADAALELCLKNGFESVETEFRKVKVI